MSQDPEDHHALLHQLIHRLKTDISGGGDREVIIDHFECLQSYMVMHFAAEDHLMLDSDYPDFEAHQKEHDAALAIMSSFDAGYRFGELRFAEDALNFVEFWATEHILTADEKLKRYLAERTRTAAA